MKQFLLSIVFTLTIFSVAQAQAPAMVGGDLSMQTKYIWRGISFNDETVLWPDLWVNWNSLTLIMFGSVDATDINERKGELTELDLYLEYLHEFKKLSLKVGYVQYAFPQNAKANDPIDYNYSIAKGTGEFYSTLSTNFKVLNLSTSVWCDLINVRGVYFQPSLTLSHTVKDLFTPELSLGLGMADSDHNAHWIGIAESGLTDFTTSLSLQLVMPGKLGSYLTVKGDLNFATVVDEELKSTLKASNMETSNLWVGLSLNGYIDLTQKEK